MSTSADVGSFIESKTSVVQTLSSDFTSEVSDYLEVHTGPDGCGTDRWQKAALTCVSLTLGVEFH